MRLGQVAYWSWPVQCRCLTRLNITSYGWHLGDSVAPIGFGLDEVIDLEPLDVESIETSESFDSPLYVLWDDSE